MRYVWVGLLAMGCAASTPVTCDVGDGTGPVTFACRGSVENYGVLSMGCAGGDRSVGSPTCVNGEAYCRTYAANPGGSTGACPAGCLFRCDDSGRVTLE